MRSLLVGAPPSPNLLDPPRPGSSESYRHTAALHTYVRNMDRETFDDYIRRFNAQDTTAFDDYIAPDMHMLNGGLELTGAEGMKEHYAKIWASFSEELHVERFVSDEETVAIRMWAHFTALDDDPDSMFGPVGKGETFDFRGLILYHVENGKFARNPGRLQQLHEHEGGWRAGRARHPALIRASRNRHPGEGTARSRPTRRPTRGTTPRRRRRRAQAAGARPAARPSRRIARRAGRTSLPCG